MKILISTTGSSGDINPFVAVGIALRKRGHEVLLVTNPHAREKVIGAGLAFQPFGRELDITEIANNPDMMDERRGPQTVWRDFILPEIPAMIETVDGVCGNFRPDVALSHHIYFGTQWLCRARGIPCAQTALCPMVLFSARDGSVYRSWEPIDPPLWYARLRRPVARLILRRFLDGQINRLRRAYGFSAVRNAFLRGTHETDLTLGLWSPHFRPPQSDDPPCARICGFCWFDRQLDQECDPHELDDFFRTGSPPIVYCLGSTAVHVAEDFYHHAAEACRLLKRRGLLLTGRQNNGHLHLDENVRAVAYAPLSVVAARGCATVHHGGVGTTGHAMRAGKPTVILPFAHDQFDNAARARRLGVSATLSRREVSAVALAQTLRPLLDDPGFAERATALGAKLDREDGAEVAADHLEHLARTKKS